MPGSKIPVLEIEKLKVTEDGRGLVFYNDGTNLRIGTTSPWTSSAYLRSGTSALTDRASFPCASSLSWLKVHYVSSSTFGPTGATCYIPVFRNLNVNVA
jgi:hypothetical protein